MPARRHGLANTGHLADGSWPSSSRHFQTWGPEHQPKHVHATILKGLGLGGLRIGLVQMIPVATATFPCQPLRNLPLPTYS